MSKERAPFLPRLARDLRALGESPRELWIVYAIKFLESVAYFSVYNLLVVYLSTDLGYPDIAAGSVMGTWLMAISVVMYFSGFITDAIGTRTAMVLSILSCLVGRAIITFGHSRGVAVAGLFVMTWGVASMLPTMTAGVRRYTNEKTVSFGFSIFYVIMNLGAFAAARIVGSFRRSFTEPMVMELPGGVTLKMTSSQLVFAVGLVATLLSLALVFFLRPDARVATAAAPAHALRINRR